MRLRSLSALMLACFVSVGVGCVGDEPTPGAGPIDGGGSVDSSPSSDASVTDTSPDPDADASSSGDGGLDAGSSCAKRGALAICEDFEAVSFPPGGWNTQVNGGGSLTAALGFDSPRGFAASHPALSGSPADAILYRDDLAILPKHTKIRVSARVKVVGFDAPESLATVFYLRLATDVFTYFAVTTSTKAVVVHQVGDSGPSIAIPFTIGSWHEIEIEIVRGATTTLGARYDGAVVGTPEAIAAVADGPKRVAVGLQSSAGAGARRVELDDFVVDLLE